MASRTPRLPLITTEPQPDMPGGVVQPTEPDRDVFAVLAEQQGALRRVATLVARGVSASEVFSAVANELARCLGVHHACLFEYLPDGTARLVAACEHPTLGTMPVGERHALQQGSVLETVLRAGRPAHKDAYDDASGSAVERMRELDLRSTAGAPIVVDGQLWGAAIVCSPRPAAFSTDTEARLAEFADLVATAISNTQARAQLTASRARIVAAADDARRRLERDLHDGAQQRLVSLGLALRNAEASVPAEQASLRAQIAGIVDGLVGVSQDLQEISRGIHPAILSKGGLGAVLQSLTARSIVPAQLDIDIGDWLPESVEVTAYYVVAEALTNVAKHARAETIQVSVAARDDTLSIAIRDDGVGGADASNGSGLIGLIDRVEAIGGRMTVASHTGTGTSILVAIPFERQ